MIISFQGSDAFKISQGDLTLAINPNSKFKADVTLLNSASTEQNKDSFMIYGPGEYEVKDIVIKGFLSSGPKGKLNTIYTINFEGMNLCFLGALSNPALSSATFESLEDIDILFVPIGGEDVLESSVAYKLAVSLEPSIIIPMNYKKEALQKFLKEGGEETIAPIEKLVIKKKDLEGKKGEIVILKEE